MTIPVGLGVSDVQAVDTTGSGRLDLVVTNKLTGQVGIVQNLGDGTFGPLEPYRAGTGLSAIDPSSSPEVTSLEATAGVAAGPLTPGGPTDLVTLNSGSKTLGVLAGLGRGRFANPVGLYTGNPAQVIRMADLTGNGIEDLVLLGTNQVTIMLGNGHGGFQKPVSYDAGFEPTGLTVADINGDRIPDLLIGNTYGDLLILQGNGDGTFRPYREADQEVALAVADLTGNGKPDFIYADQSLDRVVVQYGTSQTKVLGDQATGLLSPGAVKLADLNGNGIPDLIVANSGSNNVLVYPGLGNGQFGPALNGGHGFFVGTNPTGITVANLNGQPDLIVANSGSNDVSILLGQGSGSNWTLVPGARVSTDAGPVAVAVGNILGNGQAGPRRRQPAGRQRPGLPRSGRRVLRSECHNVPRGPGARRTVPGRLQRLGHADRHAQWRLELDLADQPQHWRRDPDDSDRRRAADVGIRGGFQRQRVHRPGGRQHRRRPDRALSGRRGGVELEPEHHQRRGAEPDVAELRGALRRRAQLLRRHRRPRGGLAAGLQPEPAARLRYRRRRPYRPDAGRDRRGSRRAPCWPPRRPACFSRSGCFWASGSSVFDLIAPLFTVSVVPGAETSVELGGEGGVALLASFTPGVPVGQSLSHDSHGSPNDTSEAKPPPKEQAETTAIEEGPTLPLWARIAIGLDRSFEQARADLLKKAGVRETAVERQQPSQPEIRNKADMAPATPPPGEHARPTKTSFHAVIDAAIARAGGREPPVVAGSARRVGTGRRRCHDHDHDRPPRLVPPIAAAALASAAALAGKWQVNRMRCLYCRVGATHQRSCK